MPRNPLAEVFGFPPDNFSANATRHRANKFCPFHQFCGLGAPSFRAERKARVIVHCMWAHAVLQ